MTKLKAEDVDGVPVVCESCGRVLTKDTVEEAENLADSHNDGRHDGNDVAFVIEEERDIDTSKVPVGQRDSFLNEVMTLVR